MGRWILVENKNRCAAAAQRGDAWAGPAWAGGPRQNPFSGRRQKVRWALSLRHPQRRRDRPRHPRYGCCWPQNSSAGCYLSRGAPPCPTRLSFFSVCFISGSPVCSRHAAPVPPPARAGILPHLDDRAPSIPPLLLTPPQHRSRVLLLLLLPPVRSNAATTNSTTTERFHEDQAPDGCSTGGEQQRLCSALPRPAHALAQPARLRDLQARRQLEGDHRAEGRRRCAGPPPRARCFPGPRPGARERQRADAAGHSAGMCLRIPSHSFSSCPFSGRPQAWPLDGWAFSGEAAEGLTDSTCRAI